MHKAAANQAAGEHCGRMCLEGWGDEKEGGVGVGGKKRRRQEKDQRRAMGFFKQPGVERGQLLGDGGRRWMCGCVDVWRCCRSSPSTTGGGRAALRVPMEYGAQRGRPADENLQLLVL